MKYTYLTVNNAPDLIDGVILHKLKVNRDPRGSLTENMKASWEDMMGPGLPFGQNYLSVTMPGFARDEDKWHNHPTKQTDRFVVIKGNGVFALYDARQESKTFGKLNLFKMGEANGDDDQYVLLIPKQVYHGFTNVGNEPLYLLGFPDQVYDPAEEGREPIAEVGAKFEDGTPFSWAAVREDCKD